ncbi:hypothetical protein VP249E411_P0025 [Vibrio phage 249E41-1]|nr:hypothetical protein VP249E411_P0025 [Vibrio phage 249E41-1]CAH9012110.1 hypothetical protein VP495E541_P0029 [Vibrio phage 495E54-1]CAH9012192.1 hypothetical protein VP496E541_P0029 [Vibrio phage 496E54-1]
MDELKEALSRKDNANSVHYICRDYILNEEHTAKDLYDTVESHISLKCDQYFDEMCEGVLDSLCGWCSPACSLLNFSNHIFKGDKLSYGLKEK